MRFLEELVHARGNGGWMPEIRRIFLLLEIHGDNRLRAALAACVAGGRCDVFAVEAALKEVA